jgi:hypothetical protein
MGELLYSMSTQPPHISSCPPSRIGERDHAPIPSDHAPTTGCTSCVAAPMAAQTPSAAFLLVCRCAAAVAICAGRSTDWMMEVAVAVQPKKKKLAKTRYHRGRRPSLEGPPQSGGSSSSLLRAAAAARVCLRWLGKSSASHSAAPTGGGAAPCGRRAAVAAALLGSNIDTKWTPLLAELPTAVRRPAAAAAARA